MVAKNCKAGECLLIGGQYLRGRGAMELNITHCDRISHLYTSNN